MSATLEIPLGYQESIVGALTAELYPDGSDTAAEANITLTEADNREGYYTASVTGLSGLHYCRVLNAGGLLRGQGWVRMNTSGRCIVSDERPSSTSSSGSTSTSTSRSYDPIFIENSGLAWITGVVDDADPTNTDGSPKTIDNATVAWELLDDDGLQVAAGSGTSVGSGTYRIDLSHSINFEVATVLHVTITSGAYVVDISRSVAPKTRTGKTPIA